MKWGFRLPGQPLSWNAAYRIGKKRGRRGEFMSLIKTPAAEAYQAEAVYLIRRAKPSGWLADGQLVIHYWMYLARDMDCDNVMKLVHDAIETAIGIDDKHFLPRVEEKTTGWGPKARLEIVIEDLGSLSAVRRTSSGTPTPLSSSSTVSRRTPSSY